MEPQWADEGSPRDPHQGSLSRTAASQWSRASCAWGGRRPLRRARRSGEHRCGPSLRSQGGVALTLRIRREAASPAACVTVPARSETRAGATIRKPVRGSSERTDIERLRPVGARRALARLSSGGTPPGLTSKDRVVRRRRPGEVGHTSCSPRRCRGDGRPVDHNRPRPVAPRRAPARVSKARTPPS